MIATLRHRTTSRRLLRIFGLSAFRSFRINTYKRPANENCRPPSRCPPEVPIFNERPGIQAAMRLEDTKALSALQREYPNRDYRHWDDAGRQKLKRAA